MSDVPMWLYSLLISYQPMYTEITSTFLTPLSIFYTRFIKPINKRFSLLRVFKRYHFFQTF